MKLLKPQWVHHDDKPIFSVDVHQECHKFATGGQGNDSGRVVIWNLLPVLYEKAELDPTIPKILCQMDNHLACVNCVRWSQNGQMLASGSDDKLVMIWKMSKGSSGVFGTGGITKNPENWKCVSTLRGHAGDVLDLAWSPQDRWLASCSVDNTIIVWDVHQLPSMVTVLKGHTSLVKGVTWDPVGKFLASQSDDRSVKIWKTSDWSCSNTITEPFEECGGTTHILRLSWSPDGQYLVSAHAMNGGGPTAQIIEREGWKCDKDFVGHRKAVTCVRFHNSILRRQAPKTNKSQQYCCLAVGSRDCSLSVWMTVLQRPLVVVHDLFRDSVLDLSWGPEKYILLACSGDGTVACLRFTDRELGTPLSEDEKNVLYQRIYGKSVTADVHGSSGRNLIIENSELLNCVQDKIKPPSLPTVQQQQQQSSLTTTNSQKTIGMSNNITTKPSNAGQQQNSTTPIKAINKQIETRTADGKRRITPMFIPLHQDSLALGDTNTTPELNSSSRNSSIGSNNIIISEKPTAIDNTSHTSTSLMNDEKEITAEEEIHLDSRLTKCNNPAVTTVPLPPARSLTLSKSFSNSSDTINTADRNNKTQINNGPPRINSGPLSKTQSDYLKSTIDYRVQVQNSNLSTNMGALSKVICWSIIHNEKLWETWVGSTIVNFCVCTKYLLLCSSDGTIRFLNIKNGTMVLPIISLSMAATQCSFCPLGILGGIITETGDMRVWDIQKQSIYITASCSDIFKSAQVIQFNITDNGIPFVLFSNGCAYSYSKQMQCWMVLNSKDPIIRHGLQTTIPKDFHKNLRIYPLTSIQASTHNFNQTNLMDLNSNNWQSTAKLIFIENQIKLCELINSPEELKYWYSMLGYYLATQGTEKRVRLVLDELLGPPSAPLNSDERKIINIDKKSLLEAVLNNLKMNPKWQRIYMEYMEQLEFANSTIK